MAYLFQSHERRTSLSYPLFHPRRVGDLPVVLSEDEFAAVFSTKDEYVELKQGISPTRVQEAVVAFPNADGGVLIHGVAPDGRMVGVTRIGERMKDVHQALREARNPGRYEVRELPVGDHKLFVVSVD